MLLYHWCCPWNSASVLIALSRGRGGAGRTFQYNEIGSASCDACLFDTHRIIADPELLHALTRLRLALQPCWETYIPFKEFYLKLPAWG